MNITKNHVWNGIFWIAIIVFMGIRSVQHTVKVHHEGVTAVFQAYKHQAQARSNFIKNTKGRSDFRPPRYGELYRQLMAVGYELDPYAYVQQNEALTHFIDQHIDEFGLLDSEYTDLQELQRRLGEQSLIFYVHATSFNALIHRLPYAWAATNVSAIPLYDKPTLAGVVVDR
jgi:hypothetical protein